mgnify:CR=1 FL=1
MVEKKVLDKEFRALVEFARGSQVPTGFGMMNDDGQVDLDAPVELWVNSRMTHVFALAEMYGIPDTAHLVDHGVTSLAHSSVLPCFLLSAVLRLKQASWLL